MVESGGLRWYVEDKAGGEGEKGVTLDQGRLYQDAGGGESKEAPFEVEWPEAGGELYVHVPIPEGTPAYVVKNLEGTEPGTVFEVMSDGSRREGPKGPGYVNVKKMRGGGLVYVGGTWLDRMLLRWMNFKSWVWVKVHARRGGDVVDPGPAMVNDGVENDMEGFRVKVAGGKVPWVKPELKVTPVEGLEYDSADRIRVPGDPE